MEQVQSTGLRQVACTCRSENEPRDLRMMRFLSTEQGRNCGSVRTVELSAGFFSCRCYDNKQMKVS